MGLFRRRGQEPDDRDEGPSGTGLKPEDLLTVRHLRDAGADLDEPRHVLHYLYVTGERQAVIARDRAAASGWQAEVRTPLPDRPDQWTVVCEHASVVLTPDFVRASTSFFESLADELGGTYDGWEASV